VTGSFQVGITEDNAALVWSPRDAPASPAGQPGARQPTAGRLQDAREALTALHPRYLRLLVDWAALQPSPRRAPDLEGPVGGCARTVGPCYPYRGVAAELAAAASQQRDGGGFEVVIDIFGTPAWAARPGSGCELSSLGAFSRPPTAAGLAAYRELIHALVTVARREGVALNWWAPWNEPNDPRFLSPQRASCSATAPAVAPTAYGAIVRAMAAQLKEEGGERHLLLGELNAYPQGAPSRTGIAEFVDQLPADVGCLADRWSVHAYANRGRAAPERDAVSMLESALDARAHCATQAPIWVTEAGAGAPHAGDPRVATASEDRASCLALAAQLGAWSGDPRVQAVFQYTFRDDPAFPVGLVGASLARRYAAYGLWLAVARQRARGSPRAPSPGECS
jgi:hypothetical protein